MTPAELADRIEDRSARGIAGAVSRLVSAGALVPGVRLPTVRQLAPCLGVSPATVSEAWQQLIRAGAIEAHGRRGTFVRSAAIPAGPRRYRRVTEAARRFPLDLSTGTPDPELLPDLRKALSPLTRDGFTANYLDDPVIPELSELLRATWPFAPEAITVVDGALDALDRIVGTLVRLGDRVLVEDPAFPLLLDLLEQSGADVIGLPCDRSGVVPEALDSALRCGPALLFVQPRAHNPTGVSMTAARARQIAQLLRPTAVTVVEDDHAADIADSPLVSIGKHLPGRVIHVRSFSKSHGPDLRLAAVGGAGEPIIRLQDRRLLGAGWSSRLLQRVLVGLLCDDTARHAVEVARDTYRDRRRALCQVLADHGVGWTGADGINLWVEVHDEHTALLSLAAAGIGAAPGSPFEVRPSGLHHLRLTVGLVPVQDAPRVGACVAEAAVAGRRRPSTRAV